MDRGRGAGVSYNEMDADERTLMTQCFIAFVVRQLLFAELGIVLN